MFFIVIDFCLEKCLICDPETNFQSLRPQWASKANCTQRKGMQTTLLFISWLCVFVTLHSFQMRCQDDFLETGTVVKTQSSKKIEFELVFKDSKVTLKFFLPEGSACLFLFPSFMTWLAHDFSGPLSIGQVDIKSNLPCSKIYFSKMTGWHFLQALKTETCL